MSHLIYPLLIVLTTLIEWVRWRQSFGRVANLNKKITVAIAVAAWFVAVAINWIFFWKFNLEWSLLFQLFVYGLECAGFRGLLYDPLLNLLIGRKINNESKTTNSKFDKKEQRKGIDFWLQRAMYGAVAVIFLILFELL